MTIEAHPTKPLRRWMAALAKPRQQEVAREELKRRGVKTYFPMIKKNVFNRFTGRFEKFPDYYFDRYFFVEHTPNWIEDVLYAKGVADVLHYDELLPAPDAVPPAVIDKAAYLKMKGRNEEFKKVPLTVSDRELYEKVRSHEVNGFIPIKKKHGLQRGQRVKVISGAMKGHKGTLAEDEGRSRIAALFNFMGSKDVKFDLEKGSVIAV
jgi:transcription antitermination factor NusG